MARNWLSVDLFGRIITPVTESTASPWSRALLRDLPARQGCASEALQPCWSMNWQLRAGNWGTARHWVPSAAPAHQGVSLCWTHLVVPAHGWAEEQTSLYFSQMEKGSQEKQAFLGFAFQPRLTFQFQRTDPVFTEGRKFKSNHSTPPCNLSLCQVLVPLKREKILVF